MNKYIIGIDGMACGMCEAHVQDVIRRHISVKKVKASYIKNNVVVITEKDLKKEEFNVIIEKTGYILISFEKLEAKKTLFGYK